MQPDLGQLAQLVQSTSFTPRGSGVRIPHCPHHSKNPHDSADFFISKKPKASFQGFLEIKKYRMQQHCEIFNCSSGFNWGSTQLILKI